MRTAFRAGRFALGLAVALAGFATTAAAEATAQDCASRSNVLGVSRVVEVDTSGGLRFGRMQYKDFSFLKPGEVVLTFDDGPLRRYSTTVLNALEEECTKAVFFMTGRMAITDPFMVREIARRGHTIGTHTWSHKNLGAQSRARAEREIELGFSAVSAALGRPVAPFFRFPYLSGPRSMIKYLKKRDVAIFSIDVDSKDYRTRSGPAMVSRTIARLKRTGKGILLFHDIQRSTAKGIRAVLRKLKRAGFKVVHLVAKQPVRTLATYDAKAAKELKRRKKSWSSRPLSKSAIKWPVSQGGLPAREPLKFIQTARVHAPSGGAPAASPSKGSAHVQGLDDKPDTSGLKAKTRVKRKSGSSGGKPVAKRARPKHYTPGDALHQKIFQD